MTDSVFTFSEEEISHTQNKGDNSIQNDTLAENEGMFAEILSKINDHFNQNNCDDSIVAVSVELFLLTCEYNAPVISPGTWETLIEL
jgi:hypothetical protein